MKNTKIKNVGNAEKLYDKLHNMVSKEYERNDRNPHWIPDFYVLSAEEKMIECLDYILEWS